jgi:antitoxin (DNA-binding transcriptional repressor) of toxin-antitoxin stability system
VNIHEAKTTLSKLIERVEQGEEIVIAATASRSRASSRRRRRRWAPVPAGDR